MFKLTYNDLKIKRKEELIAYILEDRRDSLTGIEDIIESIRGIDLNYNQENFILMCLDSANNILKIKNLFKGGIASTTVDIKVIFIEILKTKCCTKIIVAHNHPSGNLSPSYKDRELTQAINDTCELFSINLIDHFIFSRKEYFSFKKEGLL